MCKYRSYKSELLDLPNIPSKDLFQNLKELAFINHFLGGHRISLIGLKKLYKQMGTFSNKTIVDIGCGGGDSLKAMFEWAKNKNESPQMIGIDLKQDCIDYAKQTCKSYPSIQFLKDDFRNVFTYKNVDIVHAALFCHHFTEADIVSFISLCNQEKAIFVINDLERNYIAYYSIKWLTKIFSASYLVKNDAPLSVQRGFKRKEWIRILDNAGIKRYSVENLWAFRHLIIIYPND
jgi:2-polyprenyl-3-methyl-5-hydroxy-6-metoxy-1,4-benzoquinol methylase